MMRFTRTVGRIGAWTLGAVVLAAASPGFARQDEEGAADTTAALEAAASTLKTVYDEGDEGGVKAALEGVLENYAGASEKARKAALKTVAEAFGRRIHSEDIGIAAARMLGEVGLDASEILGRAMRDRSLAKGRPRVREEVIRAMGKLGDVRQAKNLTRLLQDKDFVVVATAAQAIGGYEKAEEKIRKQLFKAVHDVYQSTYGQTQDPRNTTYRRKWDIIKADCEATLRKLSGQSDLTTPMAWLTWYNKNKKSRWPLPDAGS